MTTFILFICISIVCVGVVWLILNRPVKSIPAPWKAPAELNNDDRAWLNSQFEIAGAEHLQIPVGLGKKVLEADVMSGRTGYAKGSVWGYPPPGMRRPSPIQAGSKRSPEQRAAARSAGYVHRPQAEIDKAVYHLRKLEESRRSKYDPATDSYYIGSRKISRQMYDYMVEDGVGNFIAYLEEPTYDTVWK